MSSPVYSFSTAARASLGHFLDDAFWSVNYDWLMLIIRSTDSCVMVSFLLRMLCAGGLSCYSSNIGVLDTLGDGVIYCGVFVAFSLGDTLGVGTLACISG